MTKLYLLISSFFLVACQSTLIQRGAHFIEFSNPASIEITQTLVVPPNSARVFLQDGEVISASQLNLYAVNCEIEINTVAQKTQIIAAGVFNIIAIAQEENAIVDRGFNKTQIRTASLDHAWASDSSPVDIKRYYHFRLVAQNPDPNSQVRAMICRGAQAEPYNARLPSYEQMKAASGKYIRFKL